MKGRCETELLAVLSGKPRPIRMGGETVHPLMHTSLESAQAQDVGKKSGAKDSAFSLFRTRYCSLVIKGKVGSM